MSYSYTGDKDFGDLIFLRRLQAPIGLILVRLPETISAIQKAAIVADVLQTYATQIVGALTVISPHGVRIAALPH
jgi:hypothetical protein